MPHNTQPETRATVASWASLRAWRMALHGADLKPRTSLLGLLIADHINGKTWQAWPSQTTLATLTGDGDYTRQVRERIAELVAAGWLVVAEPGGPRKAARYALTLPTGRESLRADGSEILRLKSLRADGRESLRADGRESLRRSPRKSVRTVRGTSTAPVDPARADARPVDDATVVDYASPRDRLGHA